MKISHPLQFRAFVAKYGADIVFSWIDIAADTLDSERSDFDFCKYVCGIRRRKIEKGEIEP